MSTVALDPLFTAEDAEAFTERHIASLAAGTLAAARIPFLLSPQACARALDAVEALPTQEYDPARVPVRIARFGPALNDYRRPDGMLDASRYWPAAEEARTTWSAAGLRPDPVHVALAALGTAWGTAVAPATICGRPVFGGTLREINAGALIHIDEVVREYPGSVFDQRVIAQLAFNVWIAVPGSGGVTSVWRRRRHSGDEAHRDAYGYIPAVVEGCQEVQHRPRLGDALLFNCSTRATCTPSRRTPAAGGSLSRSSSP